MFLTIVIILIVSISFFLAYRSMKDYQEKPHKKVPHGIFLVQNPQSFNESILTDIYQKAKSHGSIISIEKLYKGPEKALVLFGPISILQQYPHLHLLELEDYTHKLSESHIRCIEIGYKDKAYKQLILDATRLTPPVVIDHESRLFYQFVCQPNHTPSTYQVTFRIAIITSNQPQREEIFQKAIGRIQLFTNLTRKLKPQTSRQLFQNYKHRSIIPSEVEKFEFTSTQLFSLINSL